MILQRRQAVHSLPNANYLTRGAKTQEQTYRVINLFLMCFLTGRNPRKLLKGVVQVFIGVNPINAQSHGLWHSRFSWTDVFDVIDHNDQRLT